MILSAKYTSAGGRTVNEDSCAIFEKGAVTCAVVADGLGGHGSGDIASGLAVDRMGTFFEAEAEVEPNDLSAWFQQINEEIYEKQSRTCRMKTTLAVLVADATKGKCFWAHVGDTRIYHFVEGSFASMTFDHSVSRMAVLAGEITMEQIRHHLDRNRLLRSIGQEEVRVELSEAVDVVRGNHAFLLCTDGFWEYVEESEMETALREAADPEQWLERMTSLLELRVDGTNDNNTAVAVWIRE